MWLGTLVHRRRLLHRAAHAACHCCGVALAAATRPAAPFLAPPPVWYVVAGVGVGQGCCHRSLPPFALSRRRAFPPGAFPVPDAVGPVHFPPPCLLAMTVWRRGGECGGCWGVCVVGVSVICRSLRAPHAIPGNSVPPAGGSVCCVCVWCGAPWRRVESGRYTRRASAANSSNTANRALSTVSASKTRGKITVCNNKATTSRVGIGRLQFVAAQRSSHTEKTQQPGNSLLHAVLQRKSLCEVVAGNCRAARGGVPQRHTGSAAA